jgi:hypothetical protein
MPITSAMIPMTTSNSTRLNPVLVRPGNVLSLLRMTCIVAIVVVFSLSFVLRGEVRGEGSSPGRGVPGSPGTLA